MTQAVYFCRWPLLLLCAAAAAVLLPSAGCSSFSRSTPTDVIQPPEREKKQEKAVRGVGNAPLQQEQKKATERAVTEARRNLASNIQSYVTGLLKDYLAQSGAGSYRGDWKAFGSLLSSETAAGLLQDLGEYSSWRSPAGDTLFVQYSVPKQQVRSAAAEHVPAMLKTVNPLGGDKQKGAAALTRFLKEGPRRRRPPTRKTAKKKEANGDEKEVSGPQVPAWLTRGPAEVHPPQEYVAEVGVGNDREQAEKAARRDVAQWLSMRMRSAASRLSRSSERRTLAEQIEQLPRTMMTYRPDVLGSPSITHTWYEPASATYYALAALERSTIRKKALDMALSAARSGRAPLKKARRSRDAGQPGRALRSYAAALGHMRKAARSALAAVVLWEKAAGGEKLDELTDKLALKETHRELSQLVGHMTLRTAGGDLQWVKPGGQPAATTVIATAQGNLASGVPVRFRLEDREDGWTTVEKTDGEGAARCRPPALQGKPGRRVAIAAELAPAELSDRLSRLRLDVPRTRFRCVLRGRKDIRFTVRANERSLSGARAAAGVLAPRLKKALKGADFAIQKLSAAEGTLWTADGKPRPARMAAACRSTAAEAGLDAPPVAVVVTCTPRLRESTETSEGTLYIVGARVQARVIDPAFAGDAGVTLFTVKAREQGAYTDDRAEAYRRARGAAAEACASRLLQKLNARLQ